VGFNSTAAVYHKVSVNKCKSMMKHVRLKQMKKTKNDEMLRKGSHQYGEILGPHWPLACKKARLIVFVVKESAGI